MRPLALLSVVLFVAVVLSGFHPAWAARQETIRITCWEGYADKAFVEDFRALVKKKYNVDVTVKPFYATGQEDFYNAAKNGTGIASAMSTREVIGVVEAATLFAPLAASGMKPLEMAVETVYSMGLPRESRAAVKTLLKALT